MTDKPTRCIDPVLKRCDECEWGCVCEAEYVEINGRLHWSSIGFECILGYNKGRPEDEPTEKELEEFRNSKDFRNWMLL